MGVRGALRSGFGGDLDPESVTAVWVPIIIFSPFIVDATVTLLKRVIRRKKIWEAHREHYYQRLVLIGWSHRRTVLVEYGVMILCGGLGVLYHHSTDNMRLLVLGVWVGVFLLLGSLVGGWNGKNVSLRDPLYRVEHESAGCAGSRPHGPSLRRGRSTPLS